MCREQELLDALRRVVADPTDLDEAKRLLAQIDEDEEAARRARDPYGDDVRTEW